LLASGNIRVVESKILPLIANGELEVSDFDAVFLWQPSRFPARVLKHLRELN
jgi:hypothetical protein